MLIIKVNTKAMREALAEALYGRYFLFVKKKQAVDFWLDIFAALA